MATLSAFFAGCDSSTQNEDAEFYAFLDSVREWQMRVYPEWATYEGIPDGDDRWTDRTMAAIHERKEKERYWLEELEHFDSHLLSESRRLEYKILRASYEIDIEGQKFPYEYLAINQLGGIQHSPARVLKVMHRESIGECERIIARLEKLPGLIDQTIDQLELGMEHGITPPRIVMRSVPGQVDSYLGEDIETNPLWVPFQNLPASIQNKEQDRLREQARELILGPVRESYRKLHSFLVEEYIPTCIEAVGRDELPQGKEWYRYLVRLYTTTDLSPEEIHQTGLAEVKRIRAEMMALAEKNGHPDITSYGNELLNTPEFYFETKEDLLKEYRALCKRIDAKIVEFIGTIPRLPYGIELIPEYAEASAPAAYYDAGSDRAARPGIFYANGYNLPARASWEMEALALHEAVPGHHLQIARADELEGKHDVLKDLFFTAYVEGWALYCEKLGKEMGFYQTDEAEFGRLNYEMWRAVRLVVDTGIHALNWDRQQAIDYFTEHTSKDLLEIEVEVDRYLVWPGQALTYKLGELKIWELRKRAEKSLGDSFNIRDFHDVILGRGAVPLSVLEEQVDEWIEMKQ